MLECIRIQGAGIDITNRKIHAAREIEPVMPLRASFVVRAASSIVTAIFGEGG